MNTQRAVKKQDTEVGGSKTSHSASIDDDHLRLADSADVIALDGSDDDDNDDSSHDAVESYAHKALEASDESSMKLFREDPVLDRRIIEGMLRDRNIFIEEMEAEGFTSVAVLRRAAELGLSEALIRQVKGVAADLAGERPGRRPAPSSLGARTCLSCDRVFLSSGPGNRLCMRCRGGDAGLAQL
jgi:hypothetical protein